MKGHVSKLKSITGDSKAPKKAAEDSKVSDSESSDSDIETAKPVKKGVVKGK